MCASAYRLVLDGPSLVSPAHVLSSEVINQRLIRVRFRLDDPGQYVAYAYPEHEKCDQWNDAETQCKQFSCPFPFDETDASILSLTDHKLAVNGSPHSLNVTGESQFHSPPRLVINELNPSPFLRPKGKFRNLFTCSSIHRAGSMGLESAPQPRSSYTAITTLQLAIKLRKTFSSKSSSPQLTNWQNHFSRISSARSHQSPIQITHTSGRRSTARSLITLSENGSKLRNPIQSPFSETVSFEIGSASSCGRLCLVIPHLEQPVRTATTQAIIRGKSHFHSLLSRNS